jgi:DNA-directed RNA polymerase subunit F
LLYPTEKSQHQLIMSTGKATLNIKQEPVSADESIEEYSFLEKISMLDSEDKSETEDDLLEILSSNDQSFAKRWNDFLGNDDAEQKTANNTADINDFKRESSEPEVRLIILFWVLFLYAQKPYKLAPRRRHLNRYTYERTVR